MHITGNVLNSGMKKRLFIYFKYTSKFHISHTSTNLSSS